MLHETQMQACNFKKVIVHNQTIEVVKCFEIITSFYSLECHLQCCICRWTIQMEQGKYAKQVEMCYRNWSKTNKKEWLPNDIICTLDVVPHGAPSVLRPDYSKCPSVDDLKTGCQQFTSRLSVDESNWCLNFIKREKEEHLSWKQRTDQELHAAGQSSFSLKHLLYREPPLNNDVESSDESTKKRIAELERLMDKNKTFPEVSVVLLPIHFTF